MFTTSVRPMLPWFNRAFSMTSPSRGSFCDVQSSSIISRAILRSRSTRFLSCFVSF